MKTAIYPGTFDPVTLGHIDIIKRGLKIFDRIIVAVGVNEDKKSLFAPEERIEMIEENVKGMPVEVESFSSLLVDYAKSKGTNIIIKGLRAMSDFESEFQMAITNRKLNKDFETVFLMTDKEYFYLSSSLAKEVARLGGEFKCLVPENVEKKFKGKFKR